MNKILITSALFTLNANADLRDTYTQQQESGNSGPSVSEGMRAIQSDINATWDAIKENGTFFVIMRGELGKPYRYGQSVTQESQNFRIINGTRIAYKQLMQDMLAVAVVGDNVLMPLAPGYGGRYDGIWKGQRFECKKVSVTPPRPL